MLYLQTQLEIYTMKNLLEYLAKKITDIDSIEVLETKLDDVLVYTIKAPKEVFGLLIGKGGKTIRAIRSLARARAIKDQERVSVQLEEI